MRPRGGSGRKGIAVSGISRRRMLIFSLQGAAGIGSVALLAACGGGGSAATGSGSATAVLSSSAAPTSAASSAAATSSAAPTTSASAATTSSASASAATTTTSVASAAATTSSGSSAAATGSASASSATTSAAAASVSSPPQLTGNVTVNFYSNGDTNIHDLWNTDLLPKWNQANPSMQIKLIFSEHGTDNQAVYDKLAGAQSAGKPTDVDIFEGDTLLGQGGAAGIFMKITDAEVPSIAKTDPNVVKQEGGYGMPYRASSVVLAYNSQFVQSPPKTLDDIYTWIKANQGKFTYNPPDTGGSGSAFVTATLKKFIPQDQLQTFQTGYDPKLESSWDQGFALLKSLGPDLLRGGFYPKGNVPVLQELGKQTVYVAPVWSDQGLSYLAQKLLPDTVKLEAITPPFSGGAAYLGVPTGSQHQAQAFKFLEWVLQPEQQSVIIDKINGYPGLEWQYMPADVQQKFAALAKNYDTFSFSSKFGSDVNKLWYEKVAGTPQPKSS